MKLKVVHVMPGAVLALAVACLADEKLAGHSSSPCACDFDCDGIADLLVGAEDGFFYHLRNPRAGTPVERPVDIDLVGRSMLI